MKEELVTFLNESPTSFHAAENVRKELLKEGYKELLESEPWTFQEGGKYFVLRNQSSVIAFRIPKMDFKGFMAAAAHTDSPALKIKSQPEIRENGYVKLNVEGYGGILLSTWFDRPLSYAGRLLVKENDTIVTKLVKADQDLFVIPNLAIHMNRKVNEGQALHIQSDLLPIMCVGESERSVVSLAAEQAGVKEEDIIDHDLFLYSRVEGRLWGEDDAMISAGHLDDLECCYTLLKGFLAAKPSDSVPVLALFDNEEVGSTTKQGANSTFLADILRRINSVCGRNEEQFYQAVASSFMVSADNAHAVHPNHAEKADPVNRPQINEGIVIKYSANQKYTTDAVSGALFREVCERADVPVQVFTNHSDIIGGATLGNLSNIHVSLNTVDIGLTQLAMHSSYETAGTKDAEYMVQAMREFYSLSLCYEGNGTYRFIK